MDIPAHRMFWKQKVVNKLKYMCEILLMNPKKNGFDKYMFRVNCCILVFQVKCVAGIIN
jgi:hypothetical protein